MRSGKYGNDQNPLPCAQHTAYASRIRIIRRQQFARHVSHAAVYPLFPRPHFLISDETSARSGARRWTPNVRQQLIQRLRAPFASPSSAAFPDTLMMSSGEEGRGRCTEDAANCIHNSSGANPYETRSLFLEMKGLCHSSPASPNQRASSRLSSSTNKRSGEEKDGPSERGRAQAT